jgi:glycosyltransferase involved in cell wall biosynthesis
MRKQKKKRMTISACMMVKDEAENLHRCLDSIKPLVDEIIIVDTGSTDDTVQICEDYGVKVYHHKWEDDYSLHRNQSISYATSDWIFIIDADEEVKFKKGFGPSNIREQLGLISNDINSGAISLVDIQQERKPLQLHTSRFFRKGQIKYEGIVHNQPNVNKNMSSFMEGMSLNHYGYALSPEKMKIKKERTLRLLKKRIAIDPLDYTAYFYLAQYYSDSGELEKSAENCEKYLSMKEMAGKHFMNAIYYHAAQNYMKLENADKAGWWINEGLKVLPKDIDLALALVEYASWQRRGDLLVIGANQFLKLYKHYASDPSLMGNRFIFNFNPEAKMFCLFHLSTYNAAQTVNSLNELKVSIPDAHPEYAAGIVADTMRLIKAIKLDRVDELFEKKSVIISDISALTGSNSIIDKAA